MRKLRHDEVKLINDRVQIQTWSGQAAASSFLTGVIFYLSKYSCLCIHTLFSFPPTPVNVWAKCTCDGEHWLFCPYIIVC